MVRILVPLMLIILGSCMNSSEIEPKLTPPDFANEVDLITATYVFNEKSYQLQHYYVGDSTKTFIEDDSFNALKKLIGGEDEDLKYLFIDAFTTDVSYYIYNSHDELIAAHPRLEESQNRVLQSKANRVKQGHEFTIIGWDLTNYGGAKRYCHYGVGLWNVSYDCGTNCNPAAICKNNDISSIHLYNWSSPVSVVGWFYDATYGSLHKPYFGVGLGVGSQVSYPDLRHLPFTSVDFRNRISSIGHAFF